MTVYVFMNSRTRRFRKIRATQGDGVSQETHTIVQKHARDEENRLGELHSSRGANPMLSYLQICEDFGVYTFESEWPDL